MPDDKFLETKFSAKLGVFVTINDSSGLRGCIGYPMPNRDLYSALSDAAVAAATRDERFSPLVPEELDLVTFEVTILSLPKRIAASGPDGYAAEIRLGLDGLIVSNDTHAGLLLPQVPTEHGWNEKEFLGQACLKAGLPDDAWTRPDTMVEKFQGTVFRELTPNGRVIRE